MTTISVYRLLLSLGDGKISENCTRVRSISTDINGNLNPILIKIDTKKGKLSATINKKLLKNSNDERNVSRTKTYNFTKSRWAHHQN